MSHDPTIAGHKWEWAAYITAALLTLAYKYLRYHWVSYREWVATEKLRQGVERTGDLTGAIAWSWLKTSAGWFFDGSADNVTSWITTIGVVWVAGVSYINRLDWLLGDFSQKVPVHASIAFLLGGLMEMLAPAIAKAVVAKLPIPDAWRKQ